MADFIVHSVPGSPFARSVQLALEEKGAAYRLNPLAPGAIHEPAYRRLHPFGRMPVIEHGDYRLYETQAILRYVDAVFPGPSLQPSRPEKIGRMNQVIGVNDWYFFPLVARTIVFQRIIAPAVMNAAPDEAAIAAALPDARLCVGELDSLLDGGPYFGGDRISLADLMLAPQIDYFAQTPEGAALLEGLVLTRWLTRMRERKSMQRTLPPEIFRKAA